VFSIDGNGLTIERRYAEADALDAFREARQATVTRFRALDEAQLARKLTPER
jgi:hypothetical protein